MSEAAEEIIDESPADTPPAEPEGGLTYEEEARNLGWVPAEEFRGAADKHIDARTFVERGRQNMPLMQSNLKKLQGEVSDLTRTIRDQSDLHKRELSTQRAELEAGYDTRLRQAVEDGDTEGYDKIHAEKTKFQSETTPLDTPAVPPEDSAAINNFIAENTWYKNDTAMTAAADAISEDIANKFPTLTAEQNLARTLSTVKQEFPHKFNGAKRPGISPVEGGRPNTGAKPKHSWGNLPQEARDAFDRLRKRGVYKDTDVKKDQASYMKSYRWET